ncbi:MAG: phenazine biosynthesis protein [Thermodesulfobacteriota bacterium]|nr:MAG: phenazine biosynthesis protein [Thermodesulfobacteriota bacterium]
MAIKIYQVDAFTNQAFSGNPAAVCVLEKEADKDWMQSVAFEMNLPETAFLYPTADTYNLRWFTPTLEVDLCGHATLASAHILWEEGHLDSHRVAQFYTRSGLLSASKNGDIIELDFPSEIEKKVHIPDGLKEGLGINPIYIGKNRFDYLVQVENDEQVRNLEPNFDLLKKVPSRGIIVTSSYNSSEYDFVSRFFAPGSGINEDPVTGSAHCCLGPFWAKKFGKLQLKGLQLSKRGGVVHVSVNGDRVILGGSAVTVFRGEIVI